MAYKNRVDEETTPSSTSSSLSEALLFATMCIIGFPVDVHIKDGSVYSGIFHTASVENQYGIVLKKARMTKKGKSNANVANGEVIETFVILSDDLVQVVAKGVLLPADGVPGNIDGDKGEAVVGAVPSSERLWSEAKKSTKSSMDKKRMNQKRQNENGFAHGFTSLNAGKEHEGRIVPANHVKNAMEVEHGKTEWINKSKTEEASGASINGSQVGDDRSRGEQDNCRKKSDFHREESVDEEQGSSSSSDACSTQVNSVEEGQTKITFKLPNGVSHDPASALVKQDNQCCERSSSADTSLDAVGSSVSTLSSPVVDATSESHLNTIAASPDMVPPQSSTESHKSSKEFKLNPGAKVFSPSFANPISATPAVPTVASMAYIPTNSHMVAVAAGQPEVGISPFVPRSSAPAKFVQYGNLTAGNAGSGSQFSQPIVGHTGSRTQPLRYAAQYHPVQAGPTHVNPNSQAVMVGRLGQLVYLQPVSPDLVQGAAGISPVPGRPLLTPHVQFPKHQGTAAGQALQLCVPQPFIANGQQPFALPSHMLLQPPFPNRPIPVPGSNGLFNTKFP